MDLLPTVIATTVSRLIDTCVRAFIAAHGPYIVSNGAAQAVIPVLLFMCVWPNSRPARFIVAMYIYLVDRIVECAVAAVRAFAVTTGIVGALVFCAHATAHYYPNVVTWLIIAPDCGRTAGNYDGRWW